jgi:hypothetical protein
MADLPCVLTEAGTWIASASANYLADPLPSAAEPWESALLNYLEPYLPRAEVTPADTVLSGLHA